MTVREPKLLQHAAFLGQHGADLGQDVTRRVHQYGLAGLGLGQQVADGLDRAGRQDMDFHGVTFAQSAGRAQRQTPLRRTTVPAEVSIPAA